MLSAMLGAPSRTRDVGSGTEYSGSMRSELRTETTVRASTRVIDAAARGATADASGGAALGGAGVAVGSTCGAAVGETTFVPATASAVPVFPGADIEAAACCTT